MTMLRNYGRDLRTLAELLLVLRPISCVGGVMLATLALNLVSGRL